MVYIEGFNSHILDHLWLTTWWGLKFSALLGLLAEIVAHLLKEASFWWFLAFILVEGLQLGYGYMISWLNVSEFLQSFLIEWL